MALQGERRALRGVVQTLMLTSHVVFVGFGFAESVFADMYEAVSARALAQPRSTVAFGTTIALRPTATNRYPEIISVSTSTGDDTSESARQLEIVLDRMVATGQVNGPLRAAYVLDRAYESSASEFDLEVRRLVEALTQATDHRSDSPVRGVVANLRRRLGMFAH